MHCSIINLFNQNTPEKTVNRMSPVEWVFEYIENNIVKELGVYGAGQTVRKQFLSSS